MSSIDVLSMGLRNLFKRKLRTFLTVLGVVVGTAAIVILISLGIGVNMSFEQQMQNWGDLTLIRLYNWDGYYNNDMSKPVIDTDTIKAINEMEHVVAATPILEMYLKFVSGRYTSQISVRGIFPETMELFGYKVREGNYLDEATVAYPIVFSPDAPFSFMTARERANGNGGGGYYGRSVMVMSSGSVSMGGMGGEAEEERKPSVNIFQDRFTMSYYYNYGEKDAMAGLPKKPDVYKISPVGWLEQTDDWERSYYSVMSIYDLEKIQADQRKWEKSMGNRNNNEYRGYERAYIKIDDINNADGVIEKVKALGFTDVYSPTESIKYLQDIAGSLQSLLAAIGAVSLFIAAIGIANTMIMSIYERTKEIGVMKVIGAKLNDIGKLFLIEASLIGLMGGVLGIGLSFIVSYILNSGEGIPFLQQITWSEDTTISYIPVWLAFAALGFSTLIGLISGLLPAFRAMRISAISAIRTE